MIRRVYVPLSHIHIFPHTQRESFPGIFALDSFTLHVSYSPPPSPPPPLQASEKYELSTLEAAKARNEYLLSLTAMNVQLQEYYDNDLPGFVNVCENKGNNVTRCAALSANTPVYQGLRLLVSVSIGCNCGSLPFSADKRGSMLTSTLTALQEMDRDYHPKMQAYVNG